MNTLVEVAVEAKALLGEGPQWDDRGRRLLWVDIDAHEIHSYDPEQGTDVVLTDLGQPVGSVGLREQGGFIAGVRDGVVLLRADGAIARHLPIEADRPVNRMNDGACDPQGGYLTGTMATDGSREQGALYRVASDLTVSTITTGVTISNGIDWSADQSLLYYADTGTGRVDVYDVDAGGGLHDRRPFVTIDPGVGEPDGLTVDAEGGVWVALWQGAAVHRYDPAGQLDKVVELPVSLVTACAFGGVDRRTLYITTARAALAPDRAGAEPLAGALFAVEPGVTGRSPWRFAG